MNILITGTGTITANNLIKVLKKDHRVIGTDTNWRRFCVGGYTCHEFFRINPCNHENFISDLVAICASEEVDVLIPIIDDEVLEICKRRLKFDLLGIKMCLPTLKTIQTCNDKFLTHKFFMKHRILSPDTKVVKPRTGVGSKGVNIVQDFIEGDEVTIDAFVDGNRVHTCPRKRLEVKAGVSYKGVTFHDPELDLIVADMLLKLGMVGACNVQAIKADGQYYFIEINPRFSGGLALSIRAGFNSPQMYLDKCLGKPIKPPKVKEKVYMVRGVKEYFYEA